MIQQHEFMDGFYTCGKFWKRFLLVISIIGGDHFMLVFTICMIDNKFFQSLSFARNFDLLVLCFQVILKQLGPNLIKSCSVYVCMCVYVSRFRESCWLVSVKNQPSRFLVIIVEKICLYRPWSYRTYWNLNALRQVD